MPSNKNIMIAGVGGQGILVAADIIALAALDAGFDVKKSEIHGMSQRGGSVTSSVKFGKNVYSPVITPGQADILLSFELLEALRQIHFLKDGGFLAVNDMKIDPLPVAVGTYEYPADIEEKLTSVVGKENFVLVNGVRAAESLGDIRTMNIYLLGAISSKIPEISNASWEKAIKSRLPEKAFDINMKALQMGVSEGK
ncbi:indolepyruvate oxidoreductase subunit beta [candidate division WOR-3 bacterium]|nr:indolepyruvate oxidoreductase subunit beta [candidate division WOR-3 bacterium]